LGNRARTTRHYQVMMRSSKRFLITFMVACQASIAAMLASLPALAYNPPTAGSPQAQTDTVRFERLSIADGLSQSVVTAIVQDSRGFMWFGTEGGLNRYNGYEFTVYKHDPDDLTTLSDNHVHAIYEDQHGELWIGTNRGLDRFDQASRKFAHYQHNPDDPQSLSVGAVRSICEDETGMLWVGTGLGLSRFDRAAQTFAHYLSGNPVRAIYADRRGELWVGTNGGLNRFHQTTETFTHYEHEPDDPNSLSDNRVQAIFEDRQGVLWIGTDGGGLDRFDRSSQTFVHYPHNPDDPNSLSDNRVQAILEDGKGRLWIGTQDGFDRLDRNQNRFIHHRHDPSDPYSLSDDVVHSVYEDRSGVLWVGTHGGLSKQDRTAHRFKLYQQGANGLSDNLVQAIFEDRSDALWIGTFAGGLDRLDRNSESLVVYQHNPDDPASLSSNDVRAIFEDREGILWIGTDWGLEQFDPQVEAFIYYPDLAGNRVTAIAEDRSGYLWIGTSAGLYRFDRATGIFMPFHVYDLIGNYVTAIYQDQVGALWVGTYSGGINLWDDTHNQFTHYRRNPDDPQSLSSDVVLSFYQDPTSDTVWIGTEAGGLNRFDQATQTFTHYTEQDGLPGDTVDCILADSDGHLWLSTNKGLSRFDPQTESFRNYDAGDGLQRGEFSPGACFQNERGEMFFGGFQGFNTFYPGQLTPNPHVPPMVVTIFDEFNRAARTDLSTDARIQLSYQDNSISFEFAALDYTASEKNQYAYVMEGLDPDWVHAGTRRRADYPSLRPGEYVFRVKGSNNDGVWNEEGIAIHITVTPPFWETWVFRGIILLVLVAGVLGGYQWRVRSIEARSRELEAQVEQRTAQLRREIEQRAQVEKALRQSEMEKAVADERSRLARDLHDSVTQSLYSLTLLAEAGQRMIKARDLSQIEGNQSRLGEIAQQALQEMRLMVYELRPLALKEEGLIGALEQRLEAVERRAGIDARLVVEGAFDLPSSVEVELYRIAQEALNNALKHARPSAVTVTIRAEDGNVVLEVIDDGRGFDPQAVSDKGGLGLVSMRERAEKLVGTLTITSAPGEGTNVQVSIKHYASREVSQ
jgi:ligand-binding sensor domain-containing protein/signal transduction histidine kinase